MQGANKGENTPLNGKGLRIGIVQARFNADITDALASACLSELEALGVAASDIHHLHPIHHADTPGPVLTTLNANAQF